MDWWLDGLPQKENPVIHPSRRPCPQLCEFYSSTVFKTAATAGSGLKWVMPPGIVEMKKSAVEAKGRILKAGIGKRRDRLLSQIHR
jgi:hypothetical protein